MISVKVLLTFAVVWFTIIQMARADDNLNPRLRDIRTITLFDALAQGASVCICKVLSVEPNQDSASRYAGKVTLSISESICGPVLKKIELAFWYESRPKRANIWPDLRSLKKRSLLCVVVPDSIDKAAPSYRGISNSALYVIDIANDDTRAISGFRKICQLRSGQNLTKLQELLRQAFDSSNRWVNSYASDALVHNGGQESYSLSEVLIGHLISKCNETGYAKYSRELTDIAGYYSFRALVDRKLTGAQRAALLRNLVAILAVKSKAINELAIHSIAFDLQPKELLEVLSKRELTILKKKLNQSPKNSSEDFIRIRDDLVASP